MTDLLAAEVVTAGELSPRGTRGRHQSPLWRIFGGIDRRWQIGLALLGLTLVVVAWEVAAARTNNPSVFPTPLAAARALQRLWSDGSLRSDLWASGQRILVGYGISVAIGVVIGMLMGSFPAAAAFFEAPIGFLRYVPASALVPVFMIWFGIGEPPKVWVIVVGTMFFNIIMVADVVRAVPRELINAAYTLGGGRWLVVRRVIARFSVPGIVDTARVNLAAAWLMLVVAEILAADHGLAVGVIRLQRFRAVDGMFAILFVFGVIGLASDLFLRWLRNRLAPWSRP